MMLTNGRNILPCAVKTIPLYHIWNDGGTRAWVYHTHIDDEKVVHYLLICSYVNNYYASAKGLSYN